MTVKLISPTLTITPKIRLSPGLHTVITGNRGTTDPLASIGMQIFPNLARSPSLTAQRSQFRLRVSMGKVRSDGPEEPQTDIRMTEERF